MSPELEAAIRRRVKETLQRVRERALDALERWDRLHATPDRSGFLGQRRKA